ncbi:unnamed protein product [Citrullus colocynthis]|uniref:Uncharacterized protein n=1 Tax=Citrullus colocynthis TaxID=252529 RepID=A0ABP0XRJ0_9ROSI
MKYSFQKLKSRTWSWSGGQSSKFQYRWIGRRRPTGVATAVGNLLLRTNRKPNFRICLLSFDLYARCP